MLSQERCKKGKMAIFERERSKDREIEVVPLLFALRRAH